MMKEILALSLVFVLAIDSVSATRVLKCGTWEPFPDVNTVMVENCNLLPCIFKTGEYFTIEIKLKPTRNVATLTSNFSVTPVENTQPRHRSEVTDACYYIYDITGTQVGCPLTANTEYVYKRSMPVGAEQNLTFYNTRWILFEGDDNIACFEAKVKLEHHRTPH